MKRECIVKLMCELYPREEAEKRVVQTGPDTVEVNCDIYKRNLRTRAHATRSAEKDAKSILASADVDYKELEDGNIQVALHEPAVSHN